MKFSKYTIKQDAYLAQITRQDYNSYRGWDMPSDEDDADPGFLVEIIGTESNDSRHDGYITWIPLGSNNYKPSETVIDRLRIEYNELLDKCNKLNSFIGTKEFYNLTPDERVDLELQQSAMKTYLLILIKRLKRMEEHESFMSK